MTDKPVDQFIHELEAVIDRYRREADLTYAETIGALEMVKADILREAGDEREP